MISTCTSCDKKHPGGDWRTRRVWWTLCGWRGVWGFFCPECHDILHQTPNGDPIDVVAYNTMMVKLKIKRSNT